MHFKQGPTGLAFSYSLLPEVANLMAIWTTTEPVPVEWDNLVPLIDYVHSLHQPRWQVRDPNHAFRSDSLFRTIHDIALTPMI